MESTDTINGHVLPSLYARWVDELLAGKIPEETAATCSDCAMCGAEHETGLRRATFFDPRVKCCSYHPDLPNFLVGGVLRDDDVAMLAGRKTVEARIADRMAVTPLGLGTDSPRSALYDHVTKKGGFGRSTLVRCPHYVDENGGGCTIWRHRNSVCTTWFCKFVRGQTGATFWKTLRRLLSAIERHLSEWCLLELNLDPATLAVIDDQREDRETGGIDEWTRDDEPARSLYRALWGEWSGREAEFYRRCAGLVEKLAWRDVLRVCGPEVRAAARVVALAYRRLTETETPRRLTAGSYRVVTTDAERVRLTTYSSLDPIDLPHDVIGVLARFDGRPTEEVKRVLERDDGIALTDGLLLRLVDFGLLVPAS